ncbi:MAG: site-specific integrase [Nitrososphaerota archaeon]|nr:site-specific integrase [Nitrososphaerota archaeon]
MSIFQEKNIRMSRTFNACHVSAEKAKNMSNHTKNETVLVDTEHNLAEYHLNMKINGYAEPTIKLSWSILEILKKRGADLNTPDSVKKVISEQNWGGNRKRNVINAYSQLLKYLGKHWEEPKNIVTRKIPLIPTEQEIDDLIAGCPVKVAAYMQLLKETALRAGEAIQLHWKDVDIQRRIITCNTPEKNSNPRMFNDLSSKLLTMLNQLPKENDNVFGVNTLDSLKAIMIRSRNKQAFKLGNPRLKEIHFHTLRHWKATMLYHQTKDILFVKQFLGHKSIDNTELYIQLEKNLFKNFTNDQFTTKVACNTEEACKLIEVGFEYVTGEYADGGKIFRKRK